MEKLIELLNEYVEETDFGDNLDEYNEAEILDEEILEVNGEYHDIEYLYTKKFGFIKWLVENDKIDRDNARLRKSLWETDTSDIDKIIYIIKNSDYHYVMREAPYEAEETLLMLLSISNSPIEDLLLYLK